MESKVMESKVMEAEIRIKVEMPENFSNAFKPEKGTKRVTEDVKIDKGEVLITLKAKDLPALKAVANSYFAWLEMGKKFGGKND